MVLSFGPSSGKSEPGIDRTKLRLAIFAVLVIGAFFALFSRLWFLQVLASEDYQELAKENRVRLTQSEPPRGRILDRNGKVLVKNRLSLTVTVDRQVVDTPREIQRVLGRLSTILDVPYKDLKTNLVNEAVSPYKPVAVAHDVDKGDVNYILEQKNHLPGVDAEELTIREYPQGATAAQIFGYVRQISPENLKDPHFKNARPRYQAGDLIGVAGLEYTYDRWLRGQPRISQVVVDSAGQVVREPRFLQEQEPGKDLYLALDIEIQKLAERALEDGLAAARSSYEAPAGAAVVMDAENGDVLALASSPTFDPALLADGITEKELDSLGQGTPDNPDDDALLDRAIQSGTPPGSTFKVVTAGAAMATGLATPYTYLGCPPVFEYREVAFNNWTSADMGTMGFPRSFEVSCDTFYYALGAKLEEAFGASAGDGSERFQKYMRTAGFGHDTGIDLPNEFDGRVPDEEWCLSVQEAGLCTEGWLPGYTVNMSIGQGDLLVTPLQMAVTFGAIANGGAVMEPHVADFFMDESDDGEEEVVKDIKPKVSSRLPLDAAEIAPINDGLLDVISGAEGTAAGAFAGFPTDPFPIYGKTGTAQIGALDSGLNYAWFVSYSEDPRYVVSVYLEKAGHGGESAAPVARQIWEGVFGIDKTTDVNLSSDASG